MVPEDIGMGQEAKSPQLRGKAVLVIGIACMVLVSGVMSAAFLITYRALVLDRKELRNLSETVPELQRALAREIERNHAFENMLENYQQIVLSYQQGALCNLSNATSVSPSLNYASVVAPAVMTVRSGSWPFISYENVGVITNLSLEIVPGRGRVLVNTQPLMGEVFQDTAILAKQTAEMISGQSLENYDLIFSITAPAEIPGVDGPSAGAAMCLLALALIDNQALRTDIALTGTIKPDGTIGAIGGLAEKAKAAMDSGSTVFFVPQENSKITVYEEVEVTIRGVNYIWRVPTQVSAEEYIETNIGIDVQLVGRIDDLLRVATTR